VCGRAPTRGRCVASLFVHDFLAVLHLGLLVSALAFQEIIETSIEARIFKVCFVLSSRWPSGFRIARESAFRIVNRRTEAFGELRKRHETPMCRTTSRPIENSRIPRFSDQIADYPRGRFDVLKKHHALPIAVGVGPDR
jgi:hypothetical protein